MYLLMPYDRDKVRGLPTSFLNLTFVGRFSLRIVVIPVPKKGMTFFVCVSKGAKFKSDHNAQLHTLEVKNRKHLCKLF